MQTVIKKRIALIFQIYILQFGFGIMDFLILSNSSVFFRARKSGGTTVQG